MLDYKLVEAFASVLGQGGFEKAARALHLSQGAVSQRVKLLEEQAGCVLLVRSTPPVPTPAGQEMLKHFRQVKRLEADLGQGLGSPGQGFDTLAVGVNADSLATWFFPAVDPFLDAHPVLLDLSVDDQAATLGLLKAGEVLGCVSDRAEPVQGCRAEYLGDMDYRLYATKSYKMKYYRDGNTLEAAEAAPILIFNRKDVMHEVLLGRALGARPELRNGFYLPSSERFAPTIATGRVAGMLPDQQAAPYLERGEFVDLLPGHVFTVRLHWHCWNLDSGRLAGFSEAIVRGARSLLIQRP
jgi:LysR family transcriptional regulator (chromosome initiation inhibitor)